MARQIAAQLGVDVSAVALSFTVVPSTGQTMMTLQVAVSEERHILPLFQKGTHVSEVAKRIRLALAAGRPLHGYKVGPDSRATPIAGLLPVPIQDFVMKAQVYGRQGTD